MESFLELYEDFEVLTQNLIGTQNINKKSQILDDIKKNIDMQQAVLKAICSNLESDEE